MSQDIVKELQVKKPMRTTKTFSLDQECAEYLHAFTLQGINSSKVVRKALQELKAKYGMPERGPKR